MEKEQKSAQNFCRLMKKAGVKQIIYLSGISNEEHLSDHLQSRLKVENIIKKSGIPYTILKAGIVVGSGSASFEIIRDLVEKLPVMVAPRWLETLCQPIAVRDVIFLLTSVIQHPRCLNDSFEIGGPDVLTYKEMLQKYAKVRNLRRYIYTLPVMTPRLSSYWLYFITNTSYKLAVNLVNSMKVNVVCQENRIWDIFEKQPLSYEQSIQRAFERIEENLVVSSWKDAGISSAWEGSLTQFIEVPQFGCFYDRQSLILGESREVMNRVTDNIFSIGGKRGWYYAGPLWRFRGFLDKVAGGTGLRRGRTNESVLKAGDALDFWRVLVADRKNRRLLLYAEMKMPGEAWLEFKIDRDKNGWKLWQTATFRPSGILGRMYWYTLLPFHYFIFKGMIKRISNFSLKNHE
jgi:hypothetical protein